MKRCIALLFSTLLSLAAHAQNLCPPATCYLSGGTVFYAGLPQSPAADIYTTTGEININVVPATWVEYAENQTIAYAGNVHLEVGGSVGAYTTPPCNRYGCTHHFSDTDMPTPPTVYNATWSYGTYVVTGFGALAIPSADCAVSAMPCWTKTTHTTTLTGTTYTWTTWTYDGPLGLRYDPSNPNQDLGQFAINAQCAGSGRCHYHGFEYTYSAPLPSSGDGGGE